MAGIVLAGPGWRRRWGDTDLTFVVDGDLTLRHDADAFAQVNPRATELVDELLSWEIFEERDSVLELYAGAGNLTLPVARRVRRVTAVEAGWRLVRNGKRNARDNGLDNVRWLRQDAGRAVDELIREGRRFTTVVLNPPRAGAKEVAPKLPDLGARRSCTSRAIRRRWRGTCGSSRPRVSHCGASARWTSFPRRFTWRRSRS